ncbi:MAG: methyltransferase regulatory domain-containing protein, partial [Gammaproteobacteria bacterium]|nr:methyltransferase regulatory domain-containing protein [Gammaproteobacteria bacterium]
DCNAPVYFSEFMAHAARHGLQYLSEAQFFETQAGIFPPDVVEVLKRISDSRIAKEQYLDFLKGRRFRQTLLCHAENNVIANPNEEAIMQFYIAAPVYPEVQPFDLNAPELVIFKGPKNSAIQTDNPLIKAALSRLGSIWPRALHFSELFNEAYSACAIKSDRSESEKALADMLLRAYAGAVVEFHLMPSDFIVQPGEHPVASPLARLQSLNGNKVTNLRHYTIRIEDPVGHHLLQLLDGSRNRADLVDALLQWADSENVDFLKQATENGSSKAIREKVADQLERSLTELGHLALLTS